MVTFLMNQLIKFSANHHHFITEECKFVFIVFKEDRNGIEGEEISLIN